MNAKQTIDLSTYNARVFTGRSNGLRARESFGVKQKVVESEHIVVIVPPDTKTLNSSFLLGMLGNEIVQCGSKEAFLKFFEFDMPYKFSSQLDESIKRALFNKTNNPDLI